MQASDAFNELRGMVCTRLHFRPASASLMDDDGSTSTDQELSQQQIEDILLRIDEEKAGCCEAAVPAFLLAFPGSSTIEAVGRFMEENHDRISAADVLKLAERFDEMKSSDKHGSFEALSKACLERLLMAASHDTLTKDIAPLLWPGRDVVEIKCNSRMDRTDIFLSDGSEWCVQSKRCIIKQRGSCVALCDAIARIQEVEESLKSHDVAESMIQSEACKDINFDVNDDVCKKVESYLARRYLSAFFVCSYVALDTKAAGRLQRIRFEKNFVHNRKFQERVAKDLKRRLAIPAILVHEARDLLDQLEEREKSRLAMRSLYEVLLGRPPESRVPSADSEAIKDAVTKRFPKSRYGNSRKADKLGNAGWGFDNLALKDSGFN